MTLLDKPKAAMLTACAQSNVSVEVGEVYLLVDAGERSVVCTTHLVESRGGHVWGEAMYTGRLLQVRGRVGA